MRREKIFVMVVLLISLAVFSACTSSQENRGKPLQVTDELKKFNSRHEVIQFLETASYSPYRMSYDMALPMGARTEIAESAMEDKASVAPQASDYSTTNIQVEGVDEADFIKNDGKYIYMIIQGKLVIVDAFPAEDAKIISETKIEGDPREFFLNDNRIVVFTQRSEEVYGFVQYDFMPRQMYKDKTYALVFDISDKSMPEKVAEYDVKGYYVTSRMIGDYVYIIVQDPVYYYPGFVDLPVVRESSKAVIFPEIYYFTNPEDNYNFNTILSFNVKEKDSANAKSFMMGYSNTIYVSEENIYITYPKNFPHRLYAESNEQRFYEIILPLLPADIRREINSIKDSELQPYEKWDRISAKLEEMYNRLDERAKRNLIEQIEGALTEYEIKREEETKKTVLHRISISNGELEYQGRGEVKGYLLNQFSMDEHNGYLRVATTFDAWTREGAIMYNNVYVLDSGMEIAGKLEKIAPDERIYSTRFIGERLYMVTFKRMDPFFVIDLSSPENPRVLGELKIPGFSDYLHPFDENHIIGLGKETDENEWGGISTKGVKIALFDVSDVSSPKMIDKFEIGDKGTESEALNDHKAFLFSKQKNLLVIPVREVTGKEYYDSRLGYYKQRVWQGVYAFTISEDGFSLKGKITHGEDDENRYWGYGSPNAVRRSLFIDNVLYTISSRKIKINDINDIDKEINEIGLPYETEYGYPYPLIRG